MALLGAMFLGNVDVAIANIAAPSIRAGLGTSSGTLELTVSGYTLAYAVLLVTSARLGEARGYRRIFQAGVAIFTAGSLACGIAPGAVVLIVARFVAGLGAALMAVLTSVVAGRHAADISGLFNTTTRLGGVIGVAVFGTTYFALVAHPGARAATHGFAVTNLALAATALGAAAAALLSLRHQADDA